MKDKANKGYWQRLAKIYAPLMESDKKFYNAICGYIRDYLMMLHCRSSMRDPWKVKLEKTNWDRDCMSW